MTGFAYGSDTGATYGGEDGKTFGFELLAPAALAAAAADETSVHLEWADQNINETNQLIIRERRVDGEWWPEKVVADAGRNVEQFLDESPQPEAEYRYRVRAMSKPADAEAESALSDVVEMGSLGFIRRCIPATGWHVEIEDDSGRALRPTMLESPDWSPRTNGLPALEIPVPDGERWQDDALKGQPLRAWKDGNRLPIDTFEGISRTPDLAVIEATGGRALRELIEGVQVDEQETHLAVVEFLNEYTPYATDVDDPATDTTPDVRMLSASGADIEEYLAGGIADDDPIDVSQLGGLELLQTLWFEEAEDLSFTGTEVIDDDGRWSGDRVVRLSSSGDGVSGTFTVGYEVPADDVGLDLLASVTGDNPGFEVSLNGETIEMIPSGILQESADQYDISWSSRLGNGPSNSLEPGFNSISIDVTSSGGGNLNLDAIAVYDSRFSYTFDDSPVDGVIDGPELRPPSVELETVDIASVEQVVGGALEVDIDDTTKAQQVAISNDQGSTWLEADNADRVEGEFAETGQQIRGRMTLSRFGEQTESPRFGHRGQSIDAIRIDADLEDTPVLLDRLFEGEGQDVLNGMAESGDFVWELRRDPNAGEDARDGMQVVWTQAGQRTQETRFPVVDWDVTETQDGSFERVIVEGASRDVDSEIFSAPPVGTGLEAVQNSPIVPGSERIYDSDTGEEFERGTDYRIRWEDGAIENLGGLVENETYAIDYRWKYRGEAILPDVDPVEVRSTKRRVSSATSVRECEQLALAVLKQVQDPRLEVEATVATSGDDPTRSLVAALSDPEIPVDGPLVIRDQNYGEGQVTYTFESRRSAGEVFDELELRLNGLADRI